MQNLRIAIIQTNQFWEDKTANQNHVEKNHFSKIAPGSCDLILLPEMFNTGFSMNAAALAEDMEGPSVKWLHNWAEKLDCQIGATLIIKDSEYFYNRFVIVSKSGLMTFYNKRHLFRMAGENDFYTAGKERILYDLNGWKILLQVCYDLRFPVFSRNKTVGDRPEYDLVIYLANWPEKRAEIWSVLLQARAIENQAFCIGVNRVGQDGKGISYSGDSALIDPWGNRDCQLTKNQEQVKILTLSYDSLTAVRTQFPAFRDAD
ncbi:MAG: amidohydrolase [Bacteroidetes bacterium]|nr:amidohydrolase [Bacteroidota bacterium]